MRLLRPTGSEQPTEVRLAPRIVLLTAAGSGTVEIMRRTGESKMAVWHWQNGS
jgi:hypothetical protein